MSGRIQIISRQQLHELIGSDEDFRLIEVLPESSYRQGHLPGAVNVPGDELRKTIPEIVPDRTTTVVVYCASPSCTASDRAAELLLALGYEDVRDYRGGKEHWKEGGLPVTTEEPMAV